mmetsp:Transcript_12452/g.26846  ORF Transcript_12452/g.26846 Transcript_12452/m.26846 type:complete len:295 (+) Transcript_12452:573-1457(+)
MYLPVARSLRRFRLSNVRRSTLGRKHVGNRWILSIRSSSTPLTTVLVSLLISSTSFSSFARSLLSSIFSLSSHCSPCSPFDFELDPPITIASQTSLPPKTINSTGRPLASAACNAFSYSRGRVLVLPHARGDEWGCIRGSEACVARRRWASSSADDDIVVVVGDDETFFCCGCCCCGCGCCDIVCSVEERGRGRNMLSTMNRSIFSGTRDTLSTVSIPWSLLPLLSLLLSSLLPSALDLFIISSTTWTRSSFAVVLDVSPAATTASLLLLFLLLLLLLLWLLLLMLPPARSKRN